MNIVNFFQHFAATCQPKGDFLGAGPLSFPTWYKYLDGMMTTDSVTGQQICNPAISSINDVWLIIAAVIDMLLRVAVLAAIAFFVWGGIQYITSQGESDRTKQAKDTLISAIVGMVIAVGASTLIAYVAGRFK